MKYDETSPESIRDFAQELQGFSLKEKIGDYSIYLGKGKIGQSIESEYFGYAVNSKRDADFHKAGIELKVCPMKYICKKNCGTNIRKSVGLSAKERIVITIINYMQLLNEVWEKATVRKKLNMLLMFYIYETSKEYFDYQFELIDLWSPSEADIKVIQEDWLFIQQKVKNGEAHLLSEGDTMYLGACTKGINSQSVRIQPNSDLTAKQRAFSLKRSYVDAIIEEILQRRAYNKATDNKMKPWLETEETFYNYILRLFNSNIGKSIREMSEKYGVKRERNAKNYISLVLNDIVKSQLGEGFSKLEEFKKAQIEMKAILLGPDGKPKEHMSFEQITYTEVINEEWEDSAIKGKFELNKHLWVVFRAKYKYFNQREVSLDDIIFETAFFWNMPIEDLDGEYKKLWSDTVEKIQEGDYNHFMTAKENRVGHIRPKAKNSADLMMTSQGTMEPKKCFWLNNDYVAEEIRKRAISSRSR